MLSISKVPDYAAFLVVSRRTSTSIRLQQIIATTSFASPRRAALPAAPITCSLGFKDGDRLHKRCDAATVLHGQRRL